MRIEINIKVYEDDHKSPNTRVLESTEAFTIKPDMPNNPYMLDQVVYVTSERIVETVCNALAKVQKEIGAITRAERTATQL